ncbi:MAG TPA: hypothetical protein PLS03_09450 [Terrimicrobiaceae bacterium]|nr:hypothetical protein [Terrimicrobiaceae bacterium]
MISLSSPHLVLAPNYVWRSYRGGSQLRGFRGEGGTDDDHFPEDWLASTVRARNGENAQGPDEGLTRVAWGPESRRLADLADEAPEYFSGRPDFGVLLKLLDSAERLHIQAHPDDAFARRRLGGRFGKTECWYVLATREADASVLLGCQRAPGAATWERMIREQDIPGMLGCFDRIPVRPGDCFVVPAGVPHAIGAGIFLLELQQPSDWVVRCEFTVGDHTLPHEARFMGLEYAECRDIFDLRPYAPDAWRQNPRVVVRTDGHVEEEIIGPAHQGFFQLRRLRGTGTAVCKIPQPAVVVGVEGCGTLDYLGSTSLLARGSTLLLPGSYQQATWTPSTTPWQILLAHPPAP